MTGYVLQTPGAEMIRLSDGRWFWPDGTPVPSGEWRWLNLLVDAEGMYLDAKARAARLQCTVVRHEQHIRDLALRVELP
jgi:hypothetical protein